MTTLGLIGAGQIGAAVARLAVAAGIEVQIANSRGPGSLRELIDELGSRAHAVPLETAARAGEMTILSIPLHAVTTLEPTQFAGRIIVDTSNYYPFRDPRIAVLDSSEITTSEYVQRHFRSSRLVKAFNNIFAHHILQLARPNREEDRTALPLAGDDESAVLEVTALLERLGFDGINTGSLAESWRFEPESSAYTRLYLADRTAPTAVIREALGAPLSRAELQHALSDVRRVDVGAREH